MKPGRMVHRLERMRFRRLIGLALVLIVLAGCAGQLRTGPENAGNACDAALITGTLARSEATGETRKLASTVPMTVEMSPEKSNSHTVV